ncbi:hypothetical protein [Ralstonia soli]|uniref:Transmembrane protein n=1 Tax=Ralstonia soli TaxID=2953896 RepID=A0ABT1AGH7_9RALS|nr:hypothetical protein [Ralstonia soli]MCO5397495.1 hypothetical protein [Ralstonia soli]
MQSLLWLSAENVAAALVVIAGGALGVHILGRAARLRAYPISTSILFGYVTSYFLLPPVATLLEWKPLTYNLMHPVLGFWHALVCLLVLLGTHKLYRKSALAMRVRLLIVNGVYRPLGFFRTPGNLQLVIMGGIGLCAMMYQVFLVGSAEGGGGGALNRFMQAMYPLAYLPYCMLVRPLIGARVWVPLDTRWKLMLAGYTVVLAAVSIGSNSRALVLIGIISLCLLAGYGLVTNTLPRHLFRMRRLVPALIVMLLLQGPAADLATSMVIARSQRNDVSAGQLLSATIEAMQNKDAIRERRIADATDNNQTWDERYLDNLFLARLANMKFADATLDLALRLDSTAQSDLRNIEWQRVLSVFPTPLIDALGLPVNKALVTTSSVGDLMLFTVTGDYDALGGFRTGSIFGSGYALFGWLYTGVLAILAFLIFVLADAQTTRRIIPSPVAGPPRWAPVFSPLAVTRYYTWVFYLTSAATGVESLSGLMVFIMRGWIEAAVVYAFTYWISRVILRILGRGAA